MTTQTDSTSTAVAPLHRVLDANAVIALLSTQPKWTVALWEGSPDPVRTSADLIAAIKEYPHAIEIHGHGTTHGNQGTWLWIRPLKCSVLIDRDAVEGCLIELDPRKDTSGRAFKLGERVGLTNHYGVVVGERVVVAHATGENGEHEYHLYPDSHCFWVPMAESRLTRAA